MIEQSSSISVLVVEDEILIGADLEAILLERGFRVIAPCASLEEAFAALQTAAPEFALLDFDLAGVSSLPLAQELRRRDIPFAFLTGSSGNEQAAREFTDAAILQKPFEPKEVLDAVHSRGRKSSAI